MTKLIAYLIPGIIIDLIIIAINTFCVSEDTFYASWYGYLMFAVLTLAIIIPCVIFYVRMPPGQNTKP